MRIENHHDPADGTLRTDYVFIRHGEEERKASYHQVYTVAELGRMLDEAGMEVVSTSSGLAGEPYELGSQRLLLVARKA